VRALLDTHVFLCAVSEPERLSESATKVIQSGANELFLSAASLWEISIKIETGKLPLPKPEDRYLRDQLLRINVSTLAVEARHALELISIPLYHRDPFDRLLIAQSLVEGIPIITADSALKQYSARIIW